MLVNYFHCLKPREEDVGLRVPPRKTWKQIGSGSLKEVAPNHHLEDPGWPNCVLEGRVGSDSSDPDIAIHHVSFTTQRDYG